MCLNLVLFGIRLAFQISGAEVHVREAVPGTSKRTAVISRTPDMIQAAQSLPF